jgi:hypothetical protein
MQLTREQRLPPGLRDLANERGLNEERVDQLARAWDTIRGGRPRTIHEWRTFYDAVEKFFDDAAP